MLHDLFPKSIAEIQVSQWYLVPTANVSWTGAKGSPADPEDYPEDEDLLTNWYYITLPLYYPIPGVEFDYKQGDIHYARIHRSEFKILGEKEFAIFGHVTGVLGEALRREMERWRENVKPEFRNAMPCCVSVRDLRSLNSGVDFTDLP